MGLRIVNLAIIRVFFRKIIKNINNKNKNIKLNDFKIK
jgi:hypothetical protein